MRELTSFEMSSVVGGEKPISEMTPFDFAPHAIAGAAAWSLASVAASQSDVWYMKLGLQFVGGVVGLGLGWFGGKYITNTVQPYL